jgi:PTS system mannitol-specific IIC component
MVPRGGVVPVLLGIGVGALVSFVVAVALVRRVGAGETAADLADAQARSYRLKPSIVGHRAIVFACDAGMGSSVLGAAVLQRKLQGAGIDAPVTHAAISELPDSADIVVVHSSLEERARKQVPHALIFVVDDFIRSAAYDKLIDVVGRRPEAVTPKKPRAARGVGAPQASGWSGARGPRD